MKNVGYFDNTLCQLKIVEESDRLIRLTFNEDWLGEDETLENSWLIEETCQQLRDYFNGQRKVFELPVSLNGTAFQIKVWNGLKKIPYGERVSYQELANRIGHPRADRAVGTANHFNPLPIIIPCHRVVRKGGQLGGYGGGTALKAGLLALEEINR